MGSYGCIVRLLSKIITSEIGNPTLLSGSYIIWVSVMGEISLYIIGSINSYNQSLNATVPANVGTTGCFRKKNLKCGFICCFPVLRVCPSYNRIKKIQYYSNEILQK